MEMAFATLLLGLAAAGLLGLIADSLGAIQAAREYERAAGLAKSAMNDILTRSPLPVGEDMGGTQGLQFGWLARAEAVEGFGQEAERGELLRIRLEVWWDSGGQRKTMALESYRRSRDR